MGQPPVGMVTDRCVCGHHKSLHILSTRRPWTWKGCGTADPEKCSCKKFTPKETLMEKTMPDLTGVEWRQASGTVGIEAVQVAFFDNYVYVRNSNNPDVVLAYTWPEWTAFIYGAQNGEFEL